jgi:hypothetical protein
MILITFAIVSALFAVSSAFQLSGFASRVQQKQSSSLRMAIEDNRELTKIFARFADDMLLLDIPGAGTPEMMNCCHGGCDNCDFSHVFDNLSAGKPKWVPVYANRQLIDGRSHMAPWSMLFYEGEMDFTNFYEDIIATSSATISKDVFIDRMKKLPSRACLGPPSSVPADELPSDETLEEFWKVIQNSVGDAAETITPAQMSTAMKALIGDDHGVMWSKFRSAVSNVSVMV